jgi:3,4-dihydroxy 2-butanone 4-phosphate synthase/GTP cyclohydrolase II
VDLLRMAGLRPVGVIAEVVADDGQMMRLPGLVALGRQKGLPVISIAQVVERCETRELRDPLTQ